MLFFFFNLNAKTGLKWKVFLLKVIKFRLSGNTFIEAGPCGLTRKIWPTNRPHPNCQIWDWLDLKKEKGVVKNVPRELITFSRSSSSTKISFLLFFIWLLDHMLAHIWMWVLEMAAADWRLICLTWYHVEWRHHVWSLTSSLKPFLFASLEMFLSQLSATFT